MEDNDVQLQLKKRARRRLVGAIFFVSVVAIVLPMVMDHEPRQVVQDVEIRIPGQDEKPFAPKFATAPAALPADSAAEKTASVAEAPPVVDSVAKPTAKVVEVVRDDKGADKPVEKPQPKPIDKSPAKAEKSAEKPAEKGQTDDARRAAAILGGQESKPAAKGEYLVMIGAFANEGNVKIIKSKLGELGIKTFSEPLETPQGKKTRLRAGPFPNRDAADKALQKMQRIGVPGVVAAKP